MKKSIKVFVAVVFIIAVLGSFTQTGYYLVKPGSVEELGGMVHIDGSVRGEAGQFYMVTVAQQSANLWLLCYSYFNPVIDLRPISGMMPPDMTREEYNNLMESWMQESKNLAKVIALRRAGYEVAIDSDGVGIAELMPGSPAEGVLQPGDIIKSIDGTSVSLAEEVVSLVQAKEIGEEVRLEVLRAEDLEEFTVKTVPHSDNPQRAALMIYVHTENWRPLIPMDIEIETGPVIGPSAGVMFVLELLDRLVPENLTRGFDIAGTGTISIDEKVGGIGGVKQKVAAAEAAGIKYFLVPAENYEEAMEAAKAIQVVPIETLGDALTFLESLDEN